MRVEQCMAESLMYERACQRLGVIIRDLAEARRASDLEHMEAGEDEDCSFAILLKGLGELKKDLEAESNRLWRMAESKKISYDWAFRQLLDGIVITAAQDYEMALSGEQDAEEKLRIEEFAEILGTKVVCIMDRIKKNHAAFSKYAKTHSNEILLETKRLKKSGAPFTDSPFKCPNCGGGLHAESVNGIKRIVCTSCYLSEVVRGDNQKK